MKGDGTVKYTGYKTGGVYTKPGLRNKRKAYWAKMRLEEQRETLRRSRAADRREHADNDYDHKWDRDSQ